jgi:hypothetical protein
LSAGNLLGKDPDGKYWNLIYASRITSHCLQANKKWTTVLVLVTNLPWIYLTFRLYKNIFKRRYWWW